MVELMKSRETRENSQTVYSVVFRWDTLDSVISVVATNSVYVCSLPEDGVYWYL